MSNFRASVLHAIGDLREETYSLPAPAPHELQISIKSTGICGSDLHYYHEFRIGSVPVQHPFVLGHESAGVVEVVGEHAKGLFQVGDRVALECGVPCGTCEICSSGRYNLCAKMAFMSSARRNPHDNGTLRERVNHPFIYCHKLPEDTDLDLGALAEPFSVALHAYNRSGLTPGATILVLGAGAVGILVAAAARIRGAAQVVIADIDEGRVNWAVKRRFADNGWPVPKRRGKDLDENLQIAKEVSEGLAKDGLPGKYDAVFECTGAQPCLQAAFYAAKSGGKVIMIGMGAPNQTLPVSEAGVRELDIIGVFRYAGVYPEAVKILSSKNPEYPEFGQLVTHRFAGLEAVKDAFKTASQPQDLENNVVLKVVIAF